MIKTDKDISRKIDTVLTENTIKKNSSKKIIGIIIPILVCIAILLIIVAYIYVQKKVLVKTVEQSVTHTTELLANNLGDIIDYSEVSIKSVSSSVSGIMVSDTLDNPSEVIALFTENTPFENIEYIRADGMNVMNIGEPFDASHRVYYIEGIKGNSGIWNNYSPKISEETLVNFYTPLVYDEEIVGVITGYIGATNQLVPKIKTTIYGEEVYGLLVDNGMVICSTMETEFEKDLSVDEFLDYFDVTEEQKGSMSRLLEEDTTEAIAFMDADGEGRICIRTVPGTDWRLAIIVPSELFSHTIAEQAENSIIAISIIALIILIYASYVLISSIKDRNETLKENVKLEEDNRLYNEKIRNAFAEITEIRDIIASADMGIWRIELVDGEKPRMYVDDTMKKLLGIEGKKSIPEETYDDWFNNIEPDAVPSVLHSVERMQEGFFDENTYLWVHPSKGTRYVRCGGTSQTIPGGYVLRGYHYDVDEVVRKDLKQVAYLRKTIGEKREYYATLGAIGNIYYSMHVLDLKEDTVTEFNAQNQVKEIINRRQGATEMMVQIMSEVTTEEHLESILQFTDLRTLADRMQNKNVITREFIGKNYGWFLASFITMTKDEEGKPIKVVYATRIIDKDKKEKEELIHKTQTDEMTGLLNRRAYEEEIYAHNDVAEKDDFIYISLDVNGLKVVNDTLGHVAGDELIIGACSCMKKVFDQYGQLYRIGGDEFVVILFVDAKKLSELLTQFDSAILNWRGKLIDGLTISYGYVSKDEYPGASVRELSAIAEKRMYEAKSEHYHKMGIDRRGQQDAHKALCELYTKILRVNLTEDTYQIVNMDAKEQTSEKGFADKISDWLSSFGMSGQVHPDDLGEYLRLTDLQYLKDYFTSNKTSLQIFYRRQLPVDW